MAQTIINEPVVMGNNALSLDTLAPIIYRDQPVITTRALAAIYGTEPINLRKNVGANRDRFVPGKHFFKINGEELKAFKNRVTESNSVQVQPKACELTLWTARGAARHAKMLDTDKAWDVFELLEENYFSRRPAVAEPTALPAGTITPVQQQELKELVQAKASVFPDAVKRKVFSQVWMRLQRKFKVPRYEELSANLFGEARDYVIAMQIRSVDAPALPEAPAAETPALPPGRTRNTLGDYDALFKNLPESPQYWMDLLSRYAKAHEAMGRELEEIKAEATKPFRVGRKSMVQTYFDASMSPMYSLFETAEKSLHLAYCQIFDAMEGCRNIWMLLKKG